MALAVVLALAAWGVYLFRTLYLLQYPRHPVESYVLGAAALAAGWVAGGPAGAPFLVAAAIVAGIFYWFYVQTGQPSKTPAVQVGGPAPDFTLPDARGNPITLSDFWGKKNVLLIFYRGSWCPWCNAQFRSVRRILREINDRDTQILAVSVDAPEESQKLSEQFGIDLLFLSDKERKVIETYNVLNERELTPHGFDSTAIPTSLVIDKKGNVRWVWQTTNYRVRLAEYAILEAVRKYA